ncbi:hypothetical protein BSI_26840 [Bacillus inaquosorum KCTC 13429]|uniref:Uncharacterized protein n=1 Tax=Bacillus inaquosorum KCTC 13429 TaxID=1236548 RepID=A0A9W5LID1_9BACI|nr:hypothetical protein BSI_26840 [Bacillus inaquosorum KCTC 13429]
MLKNKAAHLDWDRINPDAVHSRAAAVLPIKEMAPTLK